MALDEQALETQERLLALLGDIEKLLDDVRDRVVDHDQEMIRKVNSSSG